MRKPMKSKTLDRVVATYPDRVVEYWSEDSDGDGTTRWWVYLNKRTFDNPGQHGWNGTVAQVANYIRKSIPCTCEDCRKLYMIGSKNPS